MFEQDKSAKFNGPASPAAGGSLWKAFMQRHLRLRDMDDGAAAAPAKKEPAQERRL